MNDDLIINRIIRDAWNAGFNVKEISGYFKRHTTFVYQRMSVRKMKIKRAQRKLELLESNL